MKCSPALVDGSRQRHSGSSPCSLGPEVSVALSPWNVLCILRATRIERGELHGINNSEAGWMVCIAQGFCAGSEPGLSQGWSSARLAPLTWMACLSFWVSRIL